MKKIFVFGLVAVSLFMAGLTACNETEEATTVDPFQAERDSLLQVIADKEQAANDFLNDFMEIQNTLRAIKEKENIVTVHAKEGEVMTEDVKESIQQDIRDIYQLLNSNKKKISELRKKMKDYDLRIEGMDKMIVGLESQIAEYKKEVADLKVQLAKKDVQIGDLERVVTTMSDQITDMNTTIDEQQVKLNTAWCRIATKKALKEEGVIDKKGNVTPEANDMFQKVDISILREVPIYASKAEILTSHPADSYEMITVDKQVEKIVIKDPEAFWSVQKRLVVQVKY